MSESPNGWSYSTLEKIGTWGSGGTPKRTNKDYYDGPIPWLVIGDLNDGLVTKSKNTITELGLSNSSAKLLKEGTILIAMYGSIGKLGIAGIECATNQAIASCVVDNEILSRNYLFYFLMSRRKQLLSLGKGGAQQNISQTVLKEYEVPIAPLKEQIRIAHKLDHVLAKVGVAQTRLEKIPTLLKRFRQSVLAAATSGELTREWSGGSKMDWRKVVLSEICNSVSDGDHQAPPKADSGVPFLVISNVSNGTLDLEDTTRWVPIDYYQNLKDIRKPRKKDILYSVTGSFGIPVIVDTDKEFCFQRHIAIIKPNHAQVYYRYLFIALADPKTLNHASEVATGTAQKTVSLTHLRNFPLALPSPEEQREIVRRVESLFALADSVEKHYLEAKKRTDRLTQSLLAKAFRGELVPQDPNDEPASELLKRIQAEREQQYASKPKRKTEMGNVSTINAKSKGKKVTMKLNEAPDTYLADLLNQFGGEADAKVLWNKTDFTIDDFYAKLKQEMQSGRIVDDKASHDPAQRKLKLAESNKA